jgi:hypothetical protein
MPTSPIQEAVARYQATRARISAEANEAADVIRRDYGMPRDRRRWSDYPGMWNNLNTQVVTRLEQARTRLVDELRAARQETRRNLYRVQTGPEGGLNRTMAEVSYRQAREFALALPLGETGVHMAMERARLAALVGDEPMLAALSLLAEERGDPTRTTVWDQIPQMWEESTGNKFTRAKLAELRESNQFLVQHADPERFTLPRLTPLAPEPEPAPSIAGGDGQVGAE